MAKTPFLLVIALSLILTGCAAQRGSVRAAQQIPDLYASADGFSARVRTTVNRGDLESDFVLLWQDRGSSASIEVASPSSVAGIRAEIAGDSRTLHYDGAALTLPETVSPLELLPMLRLCWQNPPAEYEASEETVTLVYYETVGEEAYELRTRFDAAKWQPLEAAVFNNGERIVLYIFELFSFA